MATRWMLTGLELAMTRTPDGAPQTGDQEHRPSRSWDRPCTNMTNRLQTDEPFMAIPVGADGSARAVLIVSRCQSRERASTDSPLPTTGATHRSPS
jgi:hypothetical protein